MQKLTKSEMETHIYLNAVDNIVLIDTSIPKDINRCKKRGYEIIKECCYDNGVVYYAEFKAPRKAITLRSITSIKNRISETQA